MFKAATACLIGLIMCLATPAMADEISDQVETGLKLYNEGQLSQAISEIEFALAQMRQKKGEALTEIFPQAPDGWQADKAESQSAGAGFMGGGISAEQAYRQKGGKGKVTVGVISDSPLMQSMGMILSNPMLIQNSGGKLTKVAGYKAIIKSEKQGRAELNAMVENKVLLKVEARGVDDAEAVVRQFAQLVDFDKLKELIK